MALESGIRFGSYEVVEAIGAGGMGEVYRAHDTTLERDVAIKVLPASFANDQARVERFEREAKTLASLNHPNIAQIHGLEKSDGTTALVMELIDGPTLADRIAAGRLPADEALNIALQIADALEAAHGQGIVHRDLKPANIKLKQDGTVKVLDFGIAKAFDLQAASGPGAPALTTPAMTQTGIILGTAAYMSPEQARGKPVDDRTDVWAFGCLLYEMLTGQPAFAGEDVAITLARILANDTDMKSLPGAITPAVRQTIELCLRKDPRKRIADIRDVKLALEGAFDTLTPQGGTQLVERKPAWRRALPIAAALVVGGVIVGSVAFNLELQPAPRPVNRFDYDLPVGHSLRIPQVAVLAFSRDGRSIVYNTDDGLYLRELGELEARLIRGTEEQLGGPVFSADGLWIAYGVGGGVLRRISVNGGAPVTITNAAGREIGSSVWLPNDEMLISSNFGVARMPVSSGVAEMIISAEGNEDYYGARVLPDGDTLIFSVRTAGNWDDAQIVAQSLSTGERIALISGGVEARYVSTGHLVYAFEDSLFAVPFDADTLTVSGPAVPVVQGVMRTSPPQGANYEISDDGTLVYLSGRVAAVARALVWVDREGRSATLSAPPRAYTSPRLSPDGMKVVVNARDQELDIWIWDLTRETLMRLSFDPGQDRFPAWSPDGQRIAYSSPAQEEGSAYDVVWQAADGTGNPERLAGASGQSFPEAFLPDSSGVLIRDDSRGNDDIAFVPLDGSGTARPLLNSAFNEAMPAVSPNGRWLAYVSDESGLGEIYVRPFPDVDAGRWQVSTGGGTEPLWSRDGRELFYRNGDALLAVAVETEANFAAGNSQVLFEGQYFGGGDSGQGGRSYDVSPDGERFLMIEPYQQAAAQLQIIVVENWFEELERLVPTE